MPERTAGERAREWLGGYVGGATSSGTPVVELLRALLAERDDLAEGRKADASMACEIMVAAIAGGADAAIVANQKMDARHSLAAVERLAADCRALRAEVARLRGEREGLAQALDRAASNWGWWNAERPPICESLPDHPAVETVIDAVEKRERARYGHLPAGTGAGEEEQGRGGSGTPGKPSSDGNRTGTPSAAGSPAPHPGATNDPSPAPSPEPTDEDRRAARKLLWGFNAHGQDEVIAIALARAHSDGAADRNAALRTRLEAAEKVCEAAEALRDKRFLDCVVEPACGDCTLCRAAATLAAWRSTRG